MKRKKFVRQWHAIPFGQSRRAQGSGHKLVTNTAWVDRLQAVVEAINNETTRLTVMKPVDAINLLEVKSQPSTPYHRPVGKDEKQLPIGTPVHFLYEPGEAEGDHKNRVTVPIIWSVTTHTVEKVVV